MHPGKYLGCATLYATVLDAHCQNFISEVPRVGSGLDEFHLISGLLTATPPSHCKASKIGRNDH